MMQLNIETTMNLLLDRMKVRQYELEKLENRLGQDINSPTVKDSKSNLNTIRRNKLFKGIKLTSPKNPIGPTFRYMNKLKLEGEAILP